MRRHGMMLALGMPILQSLSVAAQTDADIWSTSAVPATARHPLLRLVDVAEMHATHAARKSRFAIYAESFSSSQTLISD